MKRRVSFGVKGYKSMWDVFFAYINNITRNYNLVKFAKQKIYVNSVLASNEETL